MKALKKVFGGIELTWEKLVLCAIVIGVVVGAIMAVPQFADTSLQDLGTYFEFWVIVGVFIITNSKGYRDSALKCFVFFLISQPLIYLVQVPFYFAGFGIFAYYKTWFIWTLFTLPMGFVGYYIKKSNILSALILSCMTILLASQGVYYIQTYATSMPRHLLAIIVCFAMIPIFILGILEHKKERILAFVIVIVAICIIVPFNAHRASNKNIAIYYNNLSEYGITLDENSEVSIDDGASAEIISNDGQSYVIVKAPADHEYHLTVTDKDNKKHKLTVAFDSGGEATVDEN